MTREPGQHSRRWRLLPPLVAPGVTQMAIDTWLLEQHRQGLHPPTLRFYHWSPMAISLGYHQHYWPSGWQHLVWQGNPLDLVRRPSGGRAVLHQGDLTYALICSGLAGSRAQNYRYLCEFLRRGWKSLGWSLNYGSDESRPASRQANCFATATAADLVLKSGFKLIGSAQLYRQGAILQHGSMRLQPDPSLFAQVFGDGTTQGLPDRLPPAAEVIDALTAAASAWFGIEFIQQPLNSAEWEAIRQQELTNTPREGGFLRAGNSP